MSDAGGYRSSLPGASRQSAHPRLHALAKPYSRPSSFAGTGLSSSATMTDLANVSGSLSPTKSPAKSFTTRPALSTSSSHRSLPRSGSDSSLFSGIKSIFSRPLQWLATPARSTLPSGPGDVEGGVGGKRDSFSSFGHDLDNPEVDEDHSPSDRRQGKRFKRNSPSPEPRPRINGRSDYEPETGSESASGSRYEVTGRAVTGFMLPPLSPNVTLKPKSHLPERLNPTNFSRPLGSSGGLSSSKSLSSMSYLDPTPDVLGSSPRKGGVLTRSKRVELSALADDEDIGRDRDGDEKGKGKEGETWSPWKSRYSTAGGAASSAAVGRPTTPGRKTPARLGEQRDYTLPSVSPFKPPPSPLAHQSPANHTPLNGGTSSLTRSATTANVRRAASVASDISMGGGRSASRGLRHSGSMLFGSVNGDKEREDERMSVDGDQRQRDGSVLDWFMRDRWEGKPGSPASLAASRRLGSAGPSLSHPPIRKGQLIWNEDEKVFVRESDLKSAQALPPMHKNEAERILYTLESMRKTPLTDARKGDILPSLGQSSRTIRKTINVPLATAAAGDSAKQRRDRERLGGDDRVSVMISPYGRRKVADQVARDARRNYTEERDLRPSPAPTASDARSATRSPSRASDVDMDEAHKDRSPVPPTPRRSSRLKHNGGEEKSSAPTPKARRSKRATSKQPESAHEEQPESRSTRRTRKTTVERGTSPTPPPPVPTIVPTITATAPSPGGASAEASVSASASTYQPLAAGERSRGGSSLRARSDVSKRTHQGAASYSRSVTPSSSGRFSAKEEDLPDMDELEQAAKIPLPSFSGISFAGLAPANGPSTTSATSSAPAPAQQESLQTPSISSQPAQSLAVPPPGRRPGGPLARLGHSNTRPRASSPLAGGSIVAEPESPPTTAPKAKATDSAELAQPPANGFFALNGSGPTPVAGSTTPLGKPPASSFFTAAAPSSGTDGGSTSKPFSFGLGKPSSAPAPAPAADAVEKPSGIPDFFGKVSAPPSGTTTPTTMPALDFGLPKKAEEPKAVPAALPAPSFSFGKPADKTETGPAAPAVTGNGSVFGGKDSASASAGFSFGAPKTAEKEQSTPSFSFGAPASKPAEPSKPAFSFGATDKPAAAEPPKSTFSFGSPSTTPAPAEKPAESAKPAFTFGAPSTPAAAEKPAEAAKPAFSFGTPSTSTPKPAEPAKPSFTFGGTSSTPTSTPPAFGAAANGATPATPAAAAAPAFGGFNFGKSAETKEKPSASATAAPSNPFGAASTTPSSGTGGTGFTFGAPSSTTTSSPFGQANGTADAAKSNPFDSTGSAAAPASTGFTFGAPPASQANGNASGFGASAPAQPSNPFGFGSSSSTTTSPALAPTSNPFGNAPTPSSPATAPFTFGAGAAPAPAAPAPAASNPFGQSQPAPAAGGFNFGFGGAAGAAQPPMATPTTPSGSFSFGAPTTPSATNAAPFSFGGAPASTTPAAAPSGGFSFGAPAPAPAFGSPVPAPADGGFSLGAADNAPASPGGRRVKALPRRGAVKR